jgi:hypothetical protein
MDEAKAGIVIVAVLMLMSVGLWTIRPQLLTYVLFLVTLLLIERAERGSKAAGWTLPVVMFVWANSHGGFLAGLAVVGIWVTVRIASLFGPESWRIRSGPSPLAACAILVLCGSAALLNPYGFQLITFLLHTATVPRPEIGEWQPLSIMTAEGITYVVVIGVTISALLWSKRPRPLSTTAVLLVIALLPLLALRHLPLFGLAFAVFVGEHLADVWNRSVTSTNSGSTLLKLMPWPIAGVFFVAAIPHFSCIRINPTFIRFPVRAVAVMKSARVEGNVATFFDWGEYLIWHLSPNVRVSVDGRRETVYSPESYTRSLQFMYGVGQWDAILERPETDMALVGRDQPTYALMRLKPGWQQVYEDSFSSLFVREGSMLAERIRNVPPPEAPPDGAGLCFPCNLADAAREEE